MPFSAFLLGQATLSLLSAPKASTWCSRRRDRQYVFTWKTEKADAGCRRLVIELADGTRRFADFLLR